MKYQRTNKYEMHISNLSKPRNSRSPYIIAHLLEPLNLWGKYVYTEYKKINTIVYMKLQMYSDKNLPPLSSRGAVKAVLPLPSCIPP